MRAGRRNADAGLALLALAALAGGGFTALASMVARRKTSRFDGSARRRVPKRRRRPTKAIASAIGPLGKPWVHGPLAAGAAALAWRHGQEKRTASVAALLSSSAASAALSHAFERYLRHRAPPPGRHSPSEPSFPSGHSLETTAVSLAGAYVLAREGLLHPTVAAPLALLLPVTSGIGRLYLDRHWTTDVLGGWTAGAAVAASCAALYELLPD